MVSTFYQNVTRLKKEKGLKSRDFSQILKNMAEERLPSFEVTERMLDRWNARGTGKGTLCFPPLEIMVLMSEILQTNLGFLLGFHGVQEMTNTEGKVSFRFSECDREYKKYHQSSLQADGIAQCSWLYRKEENMPQKSSIMPYIRIAKATGLDIDYVLGLTDNRHWQTYCVVNGMYDRLLANTFLLLDEEEKLIGVITEDGKYRDSQGNVEDLSSLERYKPKVIAGFDIY